MLILKVNIGHHPAARDNQVNTGCLPAQLLIPVGPLHHLTVPHAGGGEGGVDAGGARALVAVRHETEQKYLSAL